MALSKNQLKKSLLDMMEKGSTNPDWTPEKAADALATAIDSYVRGGVVTGIRVQPDRVVAAIPPGTVFNQTTSVSLQ